MSDRLAAVCPEPGKAYPGIPQSTINRLDVRNASSFAARIECPVTYPCDHSHGKRMTQSSRLAPSGTNQTPAAPVPRSAPVPPAVPVAPVPPAVPVPAAACPVLPVALPLTSHPPLATCHVGGSGSSWIITSPRDAAAWLWGRGLKQHRCSIDAAWATSMFHRCCFRAGVGAEVGRPGEAGGAGGLREAYGVSGTDRPRAAGQCRSIRRRIYRNRARRIYRNRTSTATASTAEAAIHDHESGAR
jgi:hypothetical protein